MYYYKMILRWVKMFLGVSQFHAEQSVGLFLTKDEVRGYPSDLIAKTNWNGVVDSNGIIKNKLTSGEYIYFPIAIAQKALGHYDKYLRDGSKLDADTVVLYADFLITQMNSDGLISTWHNQQRDVANNFSAMTQGEAISVLCRAYLLTKNNGYIEKAHILSGKLLEKSEFNLNFKRDELHLLSEMPNNDSDIVLNGCFFSLWGLMELNILSSNEKLSNVISQIVSSIEKSLDYYDTGYWSYYDLKGNLASPFYHQLHINQLKAMYIMTGNEAFNSIATKWDRYQINRLYKARALVGKVVQKLRAKRYNEFV